MKIFIFDETTDVKKILTHFLSSNESFLNFVKNTCAFVMLILKYVFVVWSPFTEQHIDRIVKVQTEIL